MPLPPYTRRLFSAYLTTQGQYVTVFEATSGYVTILRDLVLTNWGTAAGIISLITNAPGGSAVLFRDDAFPPGKSVHVDLRQQLVVGEPVQMFTTCVTASALATGYLLALSPT